jgi:hypothetical protein
MDIHFPFADKKILQFSQTLSMTDRERDGIEKPILRDIFKDTDLPASILHRDVLCSKQNLLQSKTNMRKGLTGKDYRLSKFQTGLTKSSYERYCLSVLMTHFCSDDLNQHC